MKPERIEDLLRTQPSDEPLYRGRLTLDPVSTDVVRAGRVRRATPSLAALGSTGAVLLVLGIAIGLLVAVGSVKPTASPASPAPSGSAGPEASAVSVIPWIYATPAPSPTPEPTADPASLPACQPADLALVAGGWGGATGSLAGGVDLINLTPYPCHIAGRPTAELLDAHGNVIARQAAADSGSAAAEVVAVQAGGDVTALLLWSNWCAPAPALPLRVSLTLTGDVAPLTAEVRRWEPLGTPRCDSPGAGSSVGLPIPLAAPEGSSIDYQPGPCAGADMEAFSGAWGPALGTEYSHLVVLNHGSLSCVLAAAPSLELRDAEGTLLASSKPAPDAWGAITLPPGWTAVAMIDLADWCSAPPALPLHLDVVVGSTRVAVKPQLSLGSESAIPLPPCNSAPNTPPPAFGYDTALTIPGSPEPPAPDPADSLPVRVTLSLPAAAAPGSIMAYSATLTNLSAYDKSLNLNAPCPSYVERLFLPGTLPSLDTVLLLNCSVPVTLAGGASLTFEMRLPIPADSPSGIATLVWQLGERGPAAKVAFEVGP